MKKENFESMLPVIAVVQQYQDAIENNLKLKHELPALTLMYSLIDALSWLSSTSNNTKIRDRFTLWVDKYLLKGGNLECSALDLYAARCAIIHTLTSDSNLSENGYAKRAIYTTDYSNKKHLENKKIDFDRFVIININLLFRELGSGILNFAKHVDTNKTVQKQVIAKAKKYYFLLPKIT